MSSLSEAKRRFLEQEDCASRKKSDVSHHDKKRKHKHKKEKKKHKKSKKSKIHRRKSSSSSSDSDGSDSDEWVEKKPADNQNVVSDNAPKRDDWMSMTGMFKTFSRDELKPDIAKEKKGQLDAYDPARSSRELNPYWKGNGSGLPSQRVESKGFQMPRSNERREDSRRTSDREKYDNYRHSGRQNWKKDHRNDEKSSKIYDEPKESTHRGIPSTSKDTTPPVEDGNACDYLTSDEMNKLGAKIIKAGIVGNDELVKELNVKLQKARDFIKLNPNFKPPSREADKNVMLTTTNARGNTMPLVKSQQTGDARSKGGNKRMETHSMSGDRVRFYADDDKYSLKQMFQKEKFGNNDDDSAAEFAKALSKQKNWDDMDDIFSDNITKNVSDAKADERNMQRAIAQHQSIQKSLDSCDYCVESGRMNRKLIVSLNSNCFIALPDKTSLVDNHCIISTVTHVSCSTMVDEDVWSEIMEYRAALVKMFNSKGKDVVFFETASYLHKYPHLIIHCVPLPRDVGDMASIYFKKAILECEAEWSNNKKVVDLKGKGIRKGIPKGLPYFWVDFGMESGFAHVIEDQRLFPKNFAQEIIGGMLDLDHKQWRKPHKDGFEVINRKVAEFNKIWKSYDPVSE